MDVSPSVGGVIEVNENVLFSYPSTSTFTSGASVHLEAMPASGYRFNNWTGDLSSTTNPTTIVIDCDKKITANFSRMMHTLTMRVDGGGSTDPTVGNYSYGEGTTVDITATPDSGWQFDSWSGDVANPGSHTTVTMSSDRTLTANFSKAKTGWWLFAGIVTVAIIVGLIIWLAVSRRTA